MKREIKFRGICPHSGTWFYGCFVNAFPDTPRIVSEGFSTPIKIETLGQFTGLKDKNGMEIYEGDIVIRSEYPYLCDDEANYVATIEWVYNGWQTVLHCVNSKKRGISSGINEQIEDDTEHDTDFEIIGNIHEAKTK